MSTAAAEGAARSQRVGWAPFKARAALVAFSTAVLALIGSMAVLDRAQILRLLPEMVVWILLIAAADLLPVDFWGRVSFTLSFPLALAAGLLLPPSASGLILLIGTVDPREFRGEVSWDRALFNRAQIALSVLLASLVFHWFGVSLETWPLVVIPASIAALTDSSINLLLMCTAAALVKGSSPLSLLRGWFDGVPLQYLLTWLALGLLALLIATVTQAVGMWAAAAFLVPLALARETLLQTQQAAETAKSLDRKDDALVAATEALIEERRDERMVVAGDLHDEVLPPLFKVHLMAQVLKQDLNTGSLLNLDDDLPDLVSATEVAQTAIRDLMANLRRSSIGAGGLRAALLRRAEELETAGSPRIEMDLTEVSASHMTENLLFQVGREAMNNAARHSRASRIVVRLSEEEEEGITLTVSDDGVGFDMRSVDRESHFGLQLIAERVKAAGGSVVVDSRLGSGTTVALTLRD